MIRIQPKKNRIEKNYLNIKKYKTDKNQTQIRYRSDTEQIQIRFRSDTDKNKTIQTDPNYFILDP